MDTPLSTPLPLSGSMYTRRKLTKNGELCNPALQIHWTKHSKKVQGSPLIEILVQVGHQLVSNGLILCIPLGLCSPLGRDAGGTVL